MLRQWEANILSSKNRVACFFASTFAIVAAMGVLLPWQLAVEPRIDRTVGGWFRPFGDNGYPSKGWDGLAPAFHGRYTIVLCMLGAVIAGRLCCSNAPSKKSPLVAGVALLAAASVSAADALLAQFGEQNDLVSLTPGSGMFFTLVGALAGAACSVRSWFISRRLCDGLSHDVFG